MEIDRGRGNRAHATVRRMMLAVAVAALALPAGDAQGQGSSGSGGRRSMASRTELESAADAAERLALSTRDKKLREHKQLEAELIRSRLKEGDFQAGHRVYLNVPGDSALSDTFTVRGDRRLMLPGLPDVSLTGVLDSELSDHLTKELAKYLKDPTVHATGLLRLQISGLVGRPGFYNVPTDALLTDAIMLGGGPVQTSNLNHIVVKRGDQTVLKGDAMSDAIRLGLTLSDLGLHPGDVIDVGGAGGGWATTGNILKATAAFILPVFFIIRRF